MALPRPDLSPDHLLHLSIYKMYVSTSSRSVSTFFNREFSIEPKLTTKEVEAIYTYLHDTENEIWVRAKNMNKAENTLLRSILAESGVSKKVWNGHLLKSAGPIAYLRLPPSPGPRHTANEAGASSRDSEEDELDPGGTSVEQNKQTTINARK